MRILQLTPGTGTFYCGSCLRDNALVRALRDRGHDAVILPLYLPFYLDQEHPDGAEDPVHMGGINVFLQEKLPFLKHLPRRLHDWLDRPGLLRWAAGHGNMTDAHKLGAMTLSMLRGADGRQRAEIERLVAWVEAEEKPDVILLSNIMLIGLARTLRRALDVPIVCSLQGEAPFLDQLPEPWHDKAWGELRARAKDIDAFVPVSHWYGEHLRERLALDPGHLHVVHNGIDLSEFQGLPARTEGPPTIGFLARLCRDKGVHTLVDAFVALMERGMVPGAHLALTGVALKEDEALLGELERRLAAAGLAGDVTVRRNASREEKLAFLGEIDVLSVPATYGESFGLYLLEALALGVPFVQPRCAAFPEILEATGGGILCEEDDAADLSLRLEELLLDPERCRRLGEAGRSAVHARFRVEDMARGVEQVCTLVAPTPPDPATSRPIASP